MALQLLKGPFTVEEFHRLGEAGILREDDRVELINGQVVEMTPIGERHAACIRRLSWLLTGSLRNAAMVDVQNPIVLDRHHQPQPDLIVLKPRADAYPHHPRPADVLLLVEVADTTVEYDRDVKLPLYAQAGIPEFWLVNIPEDWIEVHQEPGPDGYRTVRIAIRGETLTPVALKGVTLRMDDILG